MRTAYRQKGFGMARSGFEPCRLFPEPSSHWPSLCLVFITAQCDPFPSGNRQSVRTDSLGRVSATAVALHWSTLRRPDARTGTAMTHAFSQSVNTHVFKCLCSLSTVWELQRIMRLISYFDGACSLVEGKNVRND